MSKYPPAHHQEAEYTNIIETLKTFPLATLITVSEGLPVITATTELVAEQVNSATEFAMSAINKTTHPQSRGKGK